MIMAFCPGLGLTSSRLRSGCSLEEVKPSPGAKSKTPEHLTLSLQPLLQTLQFLKNFPNILMSPQVHIQLPIHRFH